MKAFKFWISAIAVSVISFSAFAQTSQGASMDTGKGGFKITVGFEQPLDGPFDFALNKGPKINTINGNTYGEMAFGGNRSPTTIAYFMASVFRDDKAVERKKPYTAEALAMNSLKENGFEGKGVPFKCPVERVEGASMACYKASGIPGFGKNSADDRRSAIAVVAVSLKNNTAGYVITGLVIEKDKAKFDADPSQTGKAANSTAAFLWNRHSFEWN